MNVYEELEDAGHTLTMVAPLLGGVTTYYCEGCGALVRIRDGEVQLFHVPKGSWSSRKACKQDTAVGTPGLSLKAKLDALHDADVAALRAGEHDVVGAHQRPPLVLVKPR